MLALLLLAAASVPVDHPRTYLLSIGTLPLKPGESVQTFSIETWGVEFRSVCRIPEGWRLKAGKSLTSDGELSGEGSQGLTWFNEPNPKALRNLVLVTLYAPVQRRDIGTDSQGRATIPATFKGSATISTDDGERKAALDYRNITLIPARHCP